jgi:hypothetical protein
MNRFRSAASVSSAARGLHIGVQVRQQWRRAGIAQCIQHLTADPAGMQRLVGRVVSEFAIQARENRDV